MEFRPSPGSSRGRPNDRNAHDRFQLIAIRLLLLALVLAAWEVLPRNGVINPVLLPRSATCCARSSIFSAGRRCTRRSW